MSTATPAASAQTSTPVGVSTRRDPVFEELGFPPDPDNLYTQTVGTMLHAADVIDLHHRVKVIPGDDLAPILRGKNSVECPGAVFGGVVLFYYSDRWFEPAFMTKAMITSKPTHIYIAQCNNLNIVMADKICQVHRSSVLTQPDETNRNSITSSHVTVFS